MEVCPICGLQAVIEDYSNGKDYKVCAECGFIVSEQQQLAFEAAYDALEGTTFCDGKSYAPENTRKSIRNRQVPEAKLKCIKNIRIISSNFKFGSDVTDAAVSLFEMAYELETVKNKTAWYKKILAICCLYVTARQRGAPITIRDISHYLPPDGYGHIHAVLKVLRTELSVEMPLVSPAAETACLLSRTSLPFPVIEMTKKILSLAQLTWLSSGRSNTVMSIAAAHWAWKSHDPYSRFKVRLTDFCSQFNLLYSSDLAKHSKEIEKVLLDLMKEIPWLKSEDIKPKSLPFYISDILKYRTSLLHKAIASFKEMENDTEQETGDLNKEYGPFLPPCMKKMKTCNSGEIESDFLLSPLSPNRTRRKIGRREFNHNVFYVDENSASKESNCQSVHSVEEIEVGNEDRLSFLEEEEADEFSELQSSHTGSYATEDGPNLETSQSVCAAVQSVPLVVAGCDSETMPYSKSAVNVVNCLEDELDVAQYLASEHEVDSKTKLYEKHE